MLICIPVILEQSINNKMVSKKCVILICINLCQFNTVNAYTELFHSSSHFVLLVKF